MKSPTICREGVPLLGDYVEGLLPARVRRAMERHVELCRLCQAFVASYLAVPAIVRGATAAPMPSRTGRDLRARLGRLAPSRR